MADNLLIELGKIAGLAGISVGAVVLIFRDVIRKKIFPQLPPDHAYKLLRLIVILAWSLGLTGILVWKIPVIVSGHGNVVVSGSSLN
jgi:hypothetical protein